MKLGNRIQQLNKTLQSIAHWATKIEKDGISLRFLNNLKDDTGEFDCLKDADQIDNVLSKVPIGGGTKLGTNLRVKVLKPLVEKATAAKKTGQMVKPRIIMIITDGEVSFLWTYRRLDEEQQSIYINPKPAGHILIFTAHRRAPRLLARYNHRSQRWRFAP